MWWRWITLFCSAPLIASEFVGPGVCQSCHPAEYTSQVRSHHAFALRPVLETALPALLASQPLRERSGISFEYEKAADGLRVTAIQGAKNASAVIGWAFGSGAQAVTPVGTIGGRYLEHRISYYTAPQAPRRTLGHPGTASKDPAAALGLVQDPETIFRCFNCHATGVEPGPDLRATIPGVTCERCHGPARNHAAGKASMPPVSSTRESVMQLCGSCHRMPERSLHTPEMDDPLSIRFAPVGLSASSCYRKGNGLTCLTCHNPHEDARRDEAYYVAKCMACHEQQRTLCTAGEKKDCVRCHMQQRSPAPYLTFTDHRIRVYRKSADRHLKE